ncbi:hypothetical protein AFLA_001539 [Aspergillus flavus NRRL3357]|nr:hypothetical protein AFLA_001539 [Aspergillus flavus NRRL3357]
MLPHAIRFAQHHFEFRTNIHLMTVVYPEISNLVTQDIFFFSQSIFIKMLDEGVKVKGREAPLKVPSLQTSIFQRMANCYTSEP